MDYKKILHSNAAGNKSLKEMLNAKQYEDTDASRKLKSECGRKKDDTRAKYAMGGVAKERLGYPM